MAVAFAVGSAPGRPRHTGQTCVFGGAPKSVAQPQNIFDAVPSSTWVSSPITGSYLARPQGTEMAGVPAREAGSVHRSLTYIDIGSATRSPSLNATTGAVGDTRTSACSKAAEKSRTISVRTFWAWP